MRKHEENRRKKTGKGNKIFRGIHNVNMVKMPFWERNIRRTILHIFQYSFPSRPILERVTGYQSMSLLDLQNHEKEMKTEVEKENKKAGMRRAEWCKRPKLNVSSSLCYFISDTKQLTKSCYQLITATMSEVKNLEVSQFFFQVVAMVIMINSVIGGFSWVDLVWLSA